MPSLVSRLGINPDEWLAHGQNFGRRYALWILSAALTLLRPQHSRIAARSIHAHHQTGRVIRGDKHGFIGAAVPLLVSRLGINPDDWLAHVQNFGGRYAGCAGSADGIRSYAARFDRSWGKGTACSATVYRVAEAGKPGRRLIWVKPKFRIGQNPVWRPCQYRSKKGILD